MRKKLAKVFVALATLGMILVGCGKVSSSTVQGEVSQSVASEKTIDEKLVVYTSFYPMYDFASKIGGDKAKVINMIPAGVEPHDWEPSTADIVNLETADIFIYNGAGMEHWTEKIVETIVRDDLVVCEAASGIDLLLGEHDHEHEHEEETDESHEAEEIAESHETEESEESHEDHDHGEYDPHIWLAPKLAKAQMENIKNAFVEADPENKAYYEANFATYGAKFDALDEEFHHSLEEVEEQNRHIVVSHEAFAYLCEAYHLEQLGIQGVDADSEPDPKKMAEIADFVKTHNVRVIFTEELISSKVAESIAKETGASILQLNPIEGLSQEQLDAGEDYFSIMNKNLEALKEALL